MVSITQTYYDDIYIIIALLWTFIFAQPSFDTRDEANGRCMLALSRIRTYLPFGIAAQY